ncbi:hypothetical protein BDC45DRAFT_493431 [Circinella umbellata]|nr:hypothetical protein BDC45DRAFT_493431 [Circinella umbellata]
MECYSLLNFFYVQRLVFCLFVYVCILFWCFPNDSQLLQIIRKRPSYYGFYICFVCLFVFAYVGTYVYFFFHFLHMGSNVVFFLIHLNKVTLVCLMLL